MEIFIAVLSSSALASLISGIFSLVTARSKKNNNLEAGVRILLYDRIKHLCNKYIEQGWVSTDAYEDLLRMHEVYHTSLKGNGFLDDKMSRVKQLPQHQS